MGSSLIILALAWEKGKVITMTIVAILSLGIPLFIGGIVGSLILHYRRKKYGRKMFRSEWFDE